mgnify:CR=1 FL=1
MGSVAEFEHFIIKERQAEGIARAKECGVYKGRAKLFPQHPARPDSNKTRAPLAIAGRFRAVSSCNCGVGARSGAMNGRFQIMRPFPAVALFSG